MMVYRLSCLYGLCVIALLTFWSVRGECIFFSCLVLYMFYIVHVEYEGSSKSFRTFIFSRETVRAGGVVIGHV